MSATTETGICGRECTQHRGIHLLEDLTIFEVVDDDLRPVPPGTEGCRLLVTNLFNKTIPLIRYELSDMVTVSDVACPCGRPWRLATSISGRSEDVLRLPTADGTVIELHPTAITGVIERAAGLRQFRAVHEPEALVVSVVPEADADTGKLCARLTDDLHGVLRAAGADCAVKVDTVDRIERRGVAGKMKLVEELSGTHRRGAG